MAKSNPSSSFKNFLKSNPAPKPQDIKAILPQGVKLDKQPAPKCPKDLIPPQD